MTISWKGSKLRDEYKYQHKQLSNYKSVHDRNKCMGLDLDFIEVRKEKIITFTDVKRFKERPTWIENKVYPQLEKIAPVLLIETDDELTKFNVKLHGKRVEKSFTKQQFFHDFLPNLENWIEKLSSTQKIADFM